MQVRVRELGRTAVKPPAVSVVISTYNQPAWLEKTLLAYARQTWTDFEIVIADDGSGDETLALLTRIGEAFAQPLRHVWHEDRGFQKCAILNRAMQQCQADYLVFSDGDCLPRSDFLAEHMRLREPGRFLSGGYCKLPMSTSQAIQAEHIASGEFTQPAWLRAHGCSGRDISIKLKVQGATAWLLDQLSPANASWNGHNASGWRQDLFAVNGFDERMQYGGEDREFGERLVNAGIRGKRIRHRAICVHLDHSRGYVNAEAIARNRAIRAETRRLRRTWSEHGIVAGAGPAVATGQRVQE